MNYENKSSVNKSKVPIGLKEWAKKREIKIISVSEPSSMMAVNIPKPPSQGEPGWIDEG